jgi:hypothetical protein
MAPDTETRRAEVGIRQVSWLQEERFDGMVLLFTEASSKKILKLPKKGENYLQLKNST